ncbi:protein of unknown function [Streptomyces murinus]
MGATPTRRPVGPRSPVRGFRKGRVHSPQGCSNKGHSCQRERDTPDRVGRRKRVPETTGSQSVRRDRTTE